jgi:hypothetical protein
MGCLCPRHEEDGRFKPGHDVRERCMTRGRRAPSPADNPAPHAAANPVHFGAAALLRYQ